MEDTARLTLAFIGEQEVHRTNTRALLEDFVEGWQKQHRKGEVRVVLPPEQDAGSDTMIDLDDWASTAGYDVGYVTPGNMITELLEEADVRLILVGDPNDDDTLYAVAEEAAKYRIQTRSLINGLEKVVFDDDDFEDDLAGLHEVDVETGEGWADEDDLTDEASKLLEAVGDVEDAPEEDAPPDLDMLAALADDGEVEAQEEIKTIAAAIDIDVAPFETWADAVVAIRGHVEIAGRNQGVGQKFIGSVQEAFVAPGALTAAQVTALYNSMLTEYHQELTKSDLQDILEENVPSLEELRDELGIQAPYTREQLEAKTFDEVKAIGLECGIPSGRGMKHGVFVNKILQATGVETDAPKRKRNRKTKLEAVAEPGEATEAKDSDNTHGTVVDLVPPRPSGIDKAVLENHVRMLRGMADELEALL